MKVYLVVNEALYADSSYFDVIEVCNSKEKAKLVMEDFVQSVISSGSLGNNVKRIAVDNFIRLENDSDYYDEVWISEREVI